MFIFFNVLFIVFLICILGIVVANEKKSILSKRQKGLLRGYWNGQDRRRHIRINLDIPVSYTLRQKKDDLITAKTKNISEGGVCIIAPVKPRLKDLFDLSIEFPEDNRNIRAKGFVVWTNESDFAKDNIRYFDIGIRFTKIKKFDKLYLIDFVSNRSRVEKIDSESKSN